MDNYGGDWSESGFMILMTIFALIVTVYETMRVWVVIVHLVAGVMCLVGAKSAPGARMAGVGFLLVFLAKAITLLVSRSGRLRHLLGFLSDQPVLEVERIVGEAIGYLLVFIGLSKLLFAPRLPTNQVEPDAHSELQPNPPANRQGCPPEEMSHDVFP